jgi:hypothetical protein
LILTTTSNTTNTTIKPTTQEPTQINKIIEKRCEVGCNYLNF